MFDLGIAARCAHPWRAFEVQHTCGRAASRMRPVEFQRLWLFFSAPRLRRLFSKLLYELLDERALRR